MYLLMFFLAALMLCIAGAGTFAVILSFTRLRYSWIVIVCAAPAFLVGGFYTCGFLLSRRPFSAWFVIFWLLLFFGAVGIVRAFYKRP